MNLMPQNRENQAKAKPVRLHFAEHLPATTCADCHAEARDVVAVGHIVVCLKCFLPRVREHTTTHGGTIKDAVLAAANSWEPDRVHSLSEVSVLTKGGR